MKKKIFIYVLMLCVVSSVYSIDKNKYSFGISTGQTMYSTFKNYQVPDSFAINFVGVSLESYFNNSFSLELGYQYYLNDDKHFAPLKHSAEMLLNYYTNNNYLFSTESFISPYVSFGLGYHHTYDGIEENQKQYFSGVGKVGLNLRWGQYLSTQITLKSEAPVVAFTNSELFEPDYLYNTLAVTLKYKFGKPAKREFVAPVFYVNETSDFNMPEIEDQKESLEDNQSGVQKTSNNEFKVDSNKESVKKTDNKSKNKSENKPEKKVIRINENDGRLNIMIDDGNDLLLEYNKYNLKVNPTDSVIIDRQKTISKDNVLPEKEKIYAHRDTIVSNLTEEQYYRLKRGEYYKDNSDSIPYRYNGVISNPPANNYGIPLRDAYQQPQVDTIYHVTSDTVYINATSPEYKKDTVHVIEREVLPDEVKNYYQRRAYDPNESYYTRSDFERRDVRESRNPNNNKEVQKDSYKEPVVSNDNFTEEKEEKKEPFFTRVKHFFTGKPAKEQNTNQIKDAESDQVSETVKDSLYSESSVSHSDYDSNNQIIEEKQDSIRILLVEMNELKNKLDAQKVDDKKEEQSIKEDVNNKIVAPQDLIVIYYELGQVKLSEKDQLHIKSNLNTLLKASKIIIEGHTDMNGTEAVNVKMSNKRLDDVMKYIVENGVTPEKIERKAYGEKFATKYNAVEERRVIIKIK